MHTSKILEIQRLNNYKYPLDLVKNTYDEFGLVVLKKYMNPNILSNIRSTMDLVCDHAIKNNLLIKDHTFYKSIPSLQLFYGDVLSIRAIEV